MLAAAMATVTWSLMGIWFAYHCCDFEFAVAHPQLGFRTSSWTLHMDSKANDSS